VGDRVGDRVGVLVGGRVGDRVGVLVAGGRVKGVKMIGGSVGARVTNVKGGKVFKTNCASAGVIAAKAITATASIAVRADGIAPLPNVWK